MIPLLWEPQAACFVPSPQSKRLVQAWRGLALDQARRKQGRYASEMTENKAKPPMRSAQRAGKRSRPEWADGLRQIYDSVLNEPLPDSFTELLAKLDAQPQIPPESGPDEGGA